MNVTDERFPAYRLNEGFYFWGFVCFSLGLGWMDFLLWLFSLFFLMLVFYEEKV